MTNDWQICCNLLRPSVNRFVCCDKCEYSTESTGMRGAFGKPHKVFLNDKHPWEICCKIFGFKCALKKHLDMHDCLGKQELVALKRKIDANGIKIYQLPECDIDEDEEFKQQAECNSDEEIKQQADLRTSMP